MTKLPFHCSTPTRLDMVLVQLFPERSRTELQRLVALGVVQVSGVTATSSATKLLGSGEIALQPAATQDLAQGRGAQGYDFAAAPSSCEGVSVLYEDEHIAVVDKPAGMVVHPGAGNHRDTLAHLLYARYRGGVSTIGGDDRPGIVHRLDKDTSGLLLVARSNQAHRTLARWFAAASRGDDGVHKGEGGAGDGGRARHKPSDNHADAGATPPPAAPAKLLRRRYLALVRGIASPAVATIDRAIGRHRTDRKRFAVRQDGRRAITTYRTQRSWQALTPPISLLQCQLATGRTHQIRVHLSAAGHPILGDKLYGKGAIHQRHSDALPALSRLNRQALHAAQLRFTHPITGEVMSFLSPLPPDIAPIIEQLDTLESGT